MPYSSDRSASILIMMAETPVHAGASEGKATLDLPIQRSVQTDWPILNDTTVRGGLRSRVHRGDANLAKQLFGTEEGDVNERHAGWFSTPDAELLLFPVASPVGLTAWVTCARAIHNFTRKASMAASASMLSTKAKENLLKLDALAGKITVSTGEALAGGDAAKLNPQSDKILLESDAYTLKPDADKIGRQFADFVVAHLLPLTEEYWKTYVRDRIVVVSDNAFTHYVQRKTDIRTRIKIGENGSAGNLFTEENLPVDAVLYTILMAAPGREDKGRDHLKTFRETLKLDERPVLQLGGDQSLGRGLLRVREMEA